MTSLPRRLVRTAKCLAALLLPLACGGPGGHDVAANAAPVVLGQLDVAEVRVTEIVQAVGISGALQPSQVVNVRAQVAGTLAQLRADRGESVDSGAVMAIIMAAGIRSQASGAVAGVASARAGLAVAEQRLEAARTLRQAGAMSEIDLRTAIATREAAQAQLAAAEAQSAMAGENAAHTSIASPIAGVVSERLVEEGEAISPGTPLFTVVNATILELAGNVAVTFAASVTVGQAVVFALEAYPGKSFRGRVARVEPTADPGTRQVGVYLHLANPGRRIVGGQFATGRVLIGTARDLSVPTTAIRDGAGTPWVFVITDGRLRRQPVALGASDDRAGLVAVKSGLKAGELVLLGPAAGLSEGARVTVSAETGMRGTGADTSAPPAPAKER